MYAKKQRGTIAPKEVVDLLTDTLRTPPGDQQQPTAKSTDPPLHVLPPAARRLVEEAEPVFGINPSHTLAGMIFATATAIGATHRVEVKPGQTDTICLYLALVGLPNANKSGALKFALRPINDRDDENHRVYKSEWKAYQDAVKAGTLPDRPKQKKVILMDYSREALATTHEVNPRGLAVLKDELSGWVKDFNRYGGGGEEPFWNQNWSGSPIAVDRKSQEPLRIANPFIAVAGTIQPKPLKELTAGERADNGFADRILFAWPEVREKPLWTMQRLPSGLQEAYHSAINNLLDLDFNTVDDELGEGWLPAQNPFDVPFSPEGQRLLFEYFNEVNKSYCDFAETPRLASMHGKFDTQMPRLALILQLLWYGYGEAGKDAITGETTRRAIELAEWFRTQSMKVYRAQYEESPLDDMDTQERQLYDAMIGARFATTDLKFTAKTLLGYSSRKTERTLRNWKTKELVTKTAHGEYAKSY